MNTIGMAGDIGLAVLAVVGGVGALYAVFMLLGLCCARRINKGGQDGR